MAERDHQQKKTEADESTEDETRHIPMDLYEEILLRFPASELLNFKLVCKDWLRLISSPQFIQKHLNRSRAGCNGTRILRALPTEIISYNYNASGNDITKKIHYPPGFSRENTIILDSCDGLICLADKESKKLGLFNPSTGKSDIRVTVIDGPRGVSFWSWFGHHPCTGEYVLVIGRYFWESGPVVAIEVYKFCGKLKLVLSTSMSRQICCLRGMMGIFLHGNIHWPAAGLNVATDQVYYMVLAYDFKKNEILEISAPAEAHFTLGIVDGCLCAVFKPGETFELWIMKEYGVEKSWTKYKNIEGYDNCSVLLPLGFFQNGDLILDADRSKLTKYSFNDKEATPLYEDHYFYINSEAIVYDDSLVSPAMIWGEQD